MNVQTNINYTFYFRSYTDIYITINIYVDIYIYIYIYIMHLYQITRQQLHAWQFLGSEVQI